MFIFMLYELYLESRGSTRMPECLICIYRPIYFPYFPMFPSRRHQFRGASRFQRNSASGNSFSRPRALTSGIVAGQQIQNDSILPIFACTALAADRNRPFSWCKDERVKRTRRRRDILGVNAWLLCFASPSGIAEAHQEALHVLLKTCSNAK